jgi:hypothetical protein
MTFLMAQAIFEPTFSCINTLIIPKPCYSSYLPAYEDGTVCSETSAYKIQTPGNYPEENIRFKSCMKYSQFYAVYVNNTWPSKDLGALFYLATVGCHFLTASLHINVSQSTAHMHGVTAV